MIRAYHRILDLKGKHVDTEVLEILGKAIIENLPDCDGMPCGVLLEKTLELLGRITAQVNYITVCLVSLFVTQLQVHRLNTINLFHLPVVFLGAK